MTCIGCRWIKIHIFSEIGFELDPNISGVPI